MSISESVYVVTGMTCGHCVASVTEEVGEVPGVVGVEVELDGGRMTVRSTEPDEPAVLAAVAEAGYTAARA